MLTVIVIILLIAAIIAVSCIKHNKINEGNRMLAQEYRNEQNALLKNSLLAESRGAIELMKTLDKFPYEHEENVKSTLVNLDKIMEENNLTLKKCSEEDYKKFEGEIKSLHEDETGGWYAIPMMAILGCIVSWVSCGVDSDSIAQNFGGRMVFALVGASIGLIISIFYSVFKRKKMENLEKNNQFYQIEETKGMSKDQIIDKVTSNKDKMIEKIFQKKLEAASADRNAAEKTLYNYLEDYTKRFDVEVQKLCLDYANSKTTEKVAEWLANIFEAEIKSADRAAHIQTISEAIEFSVFEDHITCGFETFDFKKNLCENLQTKIQQAAIARVIAGDLQLNMTMKFPQDVSGTAAQVSITYKYDNLAAVSVLTYNAANGDFKMAEKW